MDKVTNVALIGAGGVGYSMIAGSTTFGLGPDARDLAIAAGSVFLMGFGGHSVRLVALGIGGTAVANLARRNFLPSLAG
jgi:hypothetical protein